jgi:hypothetical protein
VVDESASLPDVLVLMAAAAAEMYVVLRALLVPACVGITSARRVTSDSVNCC